MITMSGLSCLVCDANLNVSSCANVFYTSLPRSGEPLVSFVSRVLRVTLAELRGSYVCTQCYNLFEMLEQAQKTVASIRCEILKAYRGNDGAKVNEADPVLRNTVPDHRTIQQTKNDHSDIHWPKQVDDSVPVNTGSPRRVDDRALSFGLDDLSANPNNEIRNDEDSKRNLGKRVIQSEKETDVKQEKPEKSEFIDEILNDSATDENKGYATKNVQAKERLRNPRRCKLCDKLFLSSNERSDARLSKHSSRASQCEKCKGKFRDISIESTDAIRTHSEEKKSDSTIVKRIENERKSVTKAKPIFSKKRLQEQGTSQSFDFAWSGSDAKDDPSDESANPLEVNQSATFREGKPLRCNSKVSKHCCPTCGKKWRTSAELKTHVKTHSTLRPYMCEKCGQAYKHKHALEIHVGMHNGINPFKCSFCNKCFTQKGALMRHLPMHTGERPYQCELCGKRFIHHTSYNMHRLSHTGKKSYKCHVCDLSLLSTSHLKRHMRVHTGEKPYNCALCGKRFAERYNLLAHQKIHDPPEAKSRKIEKSRYKCDRCDSTFEEKQSLMDHAKLHANGNTDLEMKEFPIQPENTLEEAWVQVNRSKLNEIMLLQNPLSEIHEDSFAVAFTDDKISLENGNYNASLQVIIQSSDTSVLTNHVAVDSTQM